MYWTPYPTWHHRTRTPTCHQGKGNWPEFFSERHQIPILDDFDQELRETTAEGVDSINDEDEEFFTQIYQPNQF